MMGTSEILIGSLALALTYTQFARGQTVDEKRLTFDAASVKPSPVVDSSYASGDKGVAIARKQPGRARRGGPGTGAPGRVYIPETSLKTLLVEAFDVGYFQVLGPDWLNQERFDIEAVMPPQTTKVQFHAMLQNLMADRFKMTMHRETRGLPGYALVVAKKASGLKQSVEIRASNDGGAPTPGPAKGSPPDALGRDGFPASLPLHPLLLDTVPTFMAPYGWRLYFQQKTMNDLVTYLRIRLQCPVADATSLTSKYDFTLTFMPQPTGQPDTQYPPAPDLFTALQLQLGLKLESEKVPAEVIVIDHMDKKPTGN
jgi:uncharacterized protein (TIGR03435 family)